MGRRRCVRRQYSKVLQLICKYFRSEATVQAAGGKIWVGSEPRKTSKFSFLVLLNPQAQQSVRRTRECEPHPGGRRRTKHAAVSANCSAAGFLQVSTTANGDEALEQVQKCSPALVLLDMAMP